MYRAGLFLALIAGFALGAIAMLLITPSPIDTGSWLQFLGALLGVGLAVLGAVYVEAWKKERSRREDRAILLDAVSELQSAVTASADVRIVEYEGEPAVRELMWKTYSRLESMQNLLAAVRADVKIVDIALWQDLYALDRAIRDGLPSVRDEIQRLTGSDMVSNKHPNPFLNFYSNHQELIGGIVYQLAGNDHLASKEIKEKKEARDQEEMD